MTELFDILDKMGLTDVSFRYDYIGDKRIAWLACVTYAGVILAECEGNTRKESLVKCINEIADNFNAGKIDMQALKKTAEIRLNALMMNEIKPIEVDEWHKIKSR